MSRERAKWYFNIEFVIYEFEIFVLRPLSLKGCFDREYSKEVVSCGKVAQLKSKLLEI